MKKLVSVLLGCLTLMCGFVAYAGNSSLQITLSRGWNVVSTPAILSSITFSNGGNGISFSKLENGQWTSVPANITNIKPLEGYMVYNNNSSNVTMTFKYKTGVTAGQSLLQQNLNYGWNFLGILTTSNPFNNITGANMSVDFTNNGSTNLKNSINSTYQRNTSSKNIANPQLGEAYGIFVNEREAIYGGVNNGGENVSNIDCNDDIVQLACALASNQCPVECGYITMSSNNNALPKTVLRGTNNVIIMTGGIINAKQSIKTSFTITGNSLGISAMKLTVDNSEYLGVRSEVGNYTEFRFNNVIFQPNSKFYFSVNIADDYNLYGANISFLGGSDILSEAIYSEDNVSLGNDEIIGYIDFVELVIKPTTLILNSNDGVTDNISERTYYIGNHTLNNTETYGLFKASYGTDELWFNDVGNAQINSVYIDGTEYDGNDVKFIIKQCTGVSYSYRCENVGEITTIGEGGKINVGPLYMKYRNDNSVLKTNPDIQVSVEITNAQNVHTYDDLYIVVSGSDYFGHSIGPVRQQLRAFRAVEGASTVVSSDYSPVTRLADDNQIIGSFSVTPSVPADGAREFKEYILSGNINGTAITSNDITVDKGYFVGENANGLIYKMSSAGANINVTLNDAAVGTVNLELVSANGIAQHMLFSNRFVGGLLVPSWSSSNVTTVDPNSIIKNVHYYLSDGTVYVHDGQITNGYSIDIRGKQSDLTIDRITYDLYIGNNSENITITNEDLGLEHLLTLSNANYYINNTVSTLPNHEPNIVYFATQENKNGSTKYTFWTKKANDVTISNIKMVAGGNEYTLNGEISDGDTIEIDALGEDDVLVTDFYWDVTKGNSTSTFHRDTHNNRHFFELGDGQITVFGTN